MDGCPACPRVPEGTCGPSPAAGGEWESPEGWEKLLIPSGASRQPPARGRWRGQGWQGTRRGGTSGTVPLSRCHRPAALRSWEQPQTSSCSCHVPPSRAGSCLGGRATEEEDDGAEVEEPLWEGLFLEKKLLALTRRVGSNNMCAWRCGVLRVSCSSSSSAGVIPSSHWISPSPPLQELGEPWHSWWLGWGWTGCPSPAQFPAKLVGTFSFQLV